MSTTGCLLLYVFSPLAGGLKPGGIAISGHTTSERFSSQSERESTSCVLLSCLTADRK